MKTLDKQRWLRRDTTLFASFLQGTEFKFAMKTLDKQEMAERNKVQRVLTESHILSLVDHPFLPTVYCTLQTETHLHFVMEVRRRHKRERSEAGQGLGSSRDC